MVTSKALSDLTVTSISRFLVNPAGGGSQVTTNTCSRLKRQTGIGYEKTFYMVHSQDWVLQELLADEAILIVIAKCS